MSQDIDLHDNRRKHPRISCGDAKVSAAVRFPDGSIQEFQVVARNISLGGVAIWRETPIEEGTQCTLALPTRDDELLGVPGTVMFSRRIGMTVNEIGIQFERPLDEADFASLKIVDVSS